MKRKYVPAIKGIRAEDFKKVFIAIISMFCGAITVLTAMVYGGGGARAMDAPMYSHDFFDNFDSAQTGVLADQAVFGDWTVFYGKEGGQEKAEIIADPTGGGRGNVLRLKNTGGGSYLHIGYKPDTFNVRNFTVTYDFYDDGGTMGWSGIYARTDNIRLRYPSTFTNLLLFEKGRGTALDSVPLADGDSRPGEDTDVYYEYSAYNSLASGSVNPLRDEYGLLGGKLRYFVTGGGAMQGSWQSAKFEVRENIYTQYIKPEGQEDWIEMGTAYLSDAKGNFFSGGFGIGVSLSNYLFDNLVFLSEDANELTVAAAHGSGDYGSFYAGQQTAGDNTEIKLYSLPAEGYAVDCWYTDAQKTAKVEISSIRIQRREFNDAEQVYFWTDEIVLDSWQDLETLTDVNGRQRQIREKYSGTAYRIVAAAMTGTNGFEYYAGFTPLSYDVTLWAESLSGGVFGTDFTGTWEQDATPKQYALLSMGDSVLIEAQPGEGYIFAGWFAAKRTGETFIYNRISLDAEFMYTVTANDADIKAAFVPDNTAAVNVTVNKAITGSDGTDYGKTSAEDDSWNPLWYPGTELSVSAESFDTFSFVGWYAGGYTADGSTLISTEQRLSMDVDAGQDIVLLAVFEITTYRIEVTDGTARETAQRVAPYGHTVTLVAKPPVRGYEFIGWTLVNVYESEQSLIERSVTFLVEHRQIKAIAEYAPISSRVQLTYNDANFGTALGGSTYQYGQQVTIKPIPKDGYVVLRYTLRGAEGVINDDGSLSFVMPENDVRVRVEFTATDTVGLTKEIAVRAAFSVVFVAAAAYFIFRKNKKD